MTAKTPPPLWERGYMSVPDWEAFTASVHDTVVTVERKQRTANIVELTPILGGRNAARLRTIRVDALARMEAALA